MRKTLVICSTVIAVVLVCVLLGTSIYAAINQSLGVSNTIKFVGTGKSMCFTLNGNVTGIENESDSKYSFVWNYDFDQSPTNTRTWALGDMDFKRNEDYSNIHITYSFSIRNTGNTNIEAWINELEYDDTAFDVTINGALDDIKVINIGSTENLSLTISPKDYNRDGVSNCNFKINIVSIE